VGEVVWSMILANEASGTLVNYARLSPWKDIQLLMQAKQIANMIAAGDYPYSTLPSLFTGNNCSTFATDLLNTGSPGVP
jgi:hypothetical protein